MDNTLTQNTYLATATEIVNTLTLNIYLTTATEIDNALTLTTYLATVTEIDNALTQNTYLAGIVAQTHVVPLHIRLVPVFAAQVAEVLEVRPQLFGAVCAHVARGPGEGGADL